MQSVPGRAAAELAKVRQAAAEISKASPTMTRLLISKLDQGGGVRRPGSFLRAEGSRGGPAADAGAPPGRSEKPPVAWRPHARPDDRGSRSCWRRAANAWRCDAGTDQTCVTVSRRQGLLPRAGAKGRPRPCDRVGEKTQYGANPGASVLETRHGGQVVSRPAIGWIVYAGEFPAYRPALDH